MRWIKLRKNFYGPSHSIVRFLRELGMGNQQKKSPNSLIVRRILLKIRMRKVLFGEKNILKRLAEFDVAEFTRRIHMESIIIQHAFKKFHNIKN